MAIVYLITNRENSKRYVGKTVNTAKRRLYEHVRQARMGVRGALYSAIRKYGPDAFSIEVIQECESDDVACTAEKIWISRLATKAPAGYNITDGGDGVGGMRHSDEFRAAMSERLKGHATSDETKAKIAAAHRGTKRSEETRQRLRDAWVRRRARGPVSEETRAKMSSAMKGRKLSAEQLAKRKLIGGFRGRTHSEETKAKMRAAKVGRVFSEEHRQHLSEAAKGRTHSGEARQKMRDSWVVRRAAREKTPDDE